MRPCDLRNKKLIEEKLRNPELKQWFRDRNAELYIPPAKTRSIRVEALIKDPKQPGVVYGAMVSLKKKMDRLFGNGNEIAQEIKMGPLKDHYFTVVTFTDKVLDNLQEVGKKVKARKIKPNKQNLINSKVGNEHVVNGEVYPTYGDALRAVLEDDLNSPTDEKVVEKQRKANIKRLKEEYFPTSDTSSVSQILFKIANSKHPLKDVARHLMKYASTNDVVISLEDAEYFMDKTTNIKGIGQYRPTPNNIRIAGKNGSKKIETLLLHEILHALSYHTLRNNGEYNKDFRKLYEKSIEKLGGYDADKLEGEYANFTIDEFFVHLFTDGQFIHKLQSIEPTDIGKYTNLFEELMDYLLSILGFVSTDNLYSQAMAVASNILEQEYNTQQSIMQENDYYDSLEEPLFSISDTSDVLFNLNTPDKQRKSINNSLNTLLTKALNRILIEKVDKDTGVVTKEAIQVQTIADYKNWHANKYPGEKIDALGVANIIDGIIAYSQDDGITMPEEAIHFIIELIQNEPEIQELLTLRDNNGVRIIEKTKVYVDNAKQYLDQYGDSAKVDKEILGKLIAQYMYDSRRANRNRNKIYRLLDKVIKLVSKSFRLAYELNPKEYPIEFRKILGIIDSKISNEQYINGSKENLIIPNPNTLNVIVGNPASKLAKVKNSLQEMVKRYDQLLQESNNKGKDWKEYKTLFNNLGMILDPNDGVHNLTPQRIADFKDVAEIALRNDPTNVDLINKVIDINKLEKMFNIFEKSKSDTNSLYSLEYRLAKIKKYYETKTYEEGLNVFLFGSGNIKDKNYTNFNYNEHGAIYDMFKAANKVAELMKTPELIRAEHIAQITEILNTYLPIVETIEQTYIGAGNKLFENDDDRNLKVGEALRLINGYIKNIHDFVNSNETHKYAQKNSYLDELTLENSTAINDRIKTLVSDNNAKEYTELSFFKKEVGLYKNAPEGWLRIFTKRIKTVQNKVKQKNYEDSIAFYNELVTLGYNELSASQITKTFYQVDSKGIPTGYINTERDVADWVAKREAYQKAIPGLLRQIANTSKVPGMKALYIPDNYRELMDRFVPIYSLEKEDRAGLPEEMKALWHLRDEFSKLWSTWEAENTEEFTEAEMEVVKEQRRATLSRYHYNKWYADNIKTYTRFDGTEITYYSGELRRPKKINENWNKLTADQKKMATVYAEALKATKLSALPDKYNFEWLTRAPQITKSMFDSISGGSRLATAKEKLKGAFSERVDDDFYNVDKEGQIVKIPPLRYNTKLDNPALLTNDILRAFVMYNGTVNHRNIFLSAMPDLQGMIDMVDTSQVVTQKSRFRSASTKEGRSSNLRAAMDHLMETIVFDNSQDKLLGSEKLTSFFRSGKKYVTALNLAYNSASMITSLLSSEADKLVNASIGDLFDMQDYKKGQKEFTTNMHNILSDFEAPIKRTKLGALAVVMGVGNNVIDNISKTNVSRGSRMLVGATKPFSGWNATEMIQSLPIIATVAHSIKKIDGQWMTKQQAFKKDPNTKKSLVDKKDWDAADSLYDMIEVKDGVIDFKDVPQNIIDIFFIKTQHTVSQMSQALSEADKGTMYKSALLSFFGVHMSWLIQQIDKMFGADIYNYETGQREMGYYTWNSISYTGEVGATFIKNLIQSTMGMKLNFQEFNDLMDTSINPTNEAKIRNTKRIGVQIAVTTTMALLAYILVGLALDDEDDEQLSPVLQMAALLALKVRVEQGAKLSFRDMHEFAMRPLSNYDASFNRFQFINSAMDVLSGEDEGYTKDNIYKGMNKWQVNLIRTTPYLKGIMESYLGWYLNENLTGGIEEQARAMKSKREGTINFVVHPTGQGADLAVKNLADFLALPTYILGNTLGKGMLEILGSNYPDNNGLFNRKLPSKKAAKIDD